MDSVFRFTGQSSYASNQAAGNILKRKGILLVPNRTQETTWSKVITNHQDAIAACDFFTTEVIGAVGLYINYVLFFIHIGSRKVNIAGITPNPDENGMKQTARNPTMTDRGFLSGCMHLIHDRDTEFCKSFRAIIESMGIKAIRLPPQVPRMNSYAIR